MSVEVFIPGDPPLAVPVYDLLKDCPTPSEIVDGHKAWPVIIDFEASEVGFLQ